MSERKSMKQEKAAGTQQALIWMGPAISGVAMPGTVYRSGLTPQIEKAVEEQPALKRLLVPVGEAAEMRKELRNPQSAASICYHNALAYRKKGVGNE